MITVHVYTTKTLHNQDLVMSKDSYVYLYVQFIMPLNKTVKSKHGHPCSIGVGTGGTCPPNQNYLSRVYLAFDAPSATIACYIVLSRCWKLLSSRTQISFSHMTHFAARVARSSWLLLLLASSTTKNGGEQ